MSRRPLVRRLEMTGAFLAAAIFGEAVLPAGWLARRWRSRCPAEPRSVPAVSPETDSREQA